MNISFTALLMMATATIAADTNILSHDVTSERAFKIEQQADHVISFTADGKFDIGLGKVDNNTRTPIYLDFQQIERYFTLQKNKELIVIVCDKNMWGDHTLKQHINSLNDFFFKCGFKRVVIQQGYAFGRGIWSDKLNPNHGLESTSAPPAAGTLETHP